MSLAQYRKKRSARKTPEPFGGSPGGDALHFVVQKHDASHLHYDFRLEMKGVLKSWAVPKGPSMDPEVKRLAMMVEDHPYDYRDFEGIIPEGEYGGGTVIVWDEGTYEPAEPVTGGLKEQEKELLHQLHTGKIKFTLHGKKLKGNFALVKARGRGENGWLLMKLEDKYAGTKDILAKDKSVLSGKTIAQMAKTPVDVWHSNKPGRKKAPAKKAAPLKKKASLKKKGPGDGDAILKEGKRGRFYSRLRPMLATLVDEAFDKPGWVYEIKWDGYRAVAFMNKGKVALKSRNDKSFNEKFYPVFEALQRWNVNAIVDGEIVVVNDKGSADFGALQNWRSEADGDLRYYVFDILWYEGRDLKALPLWERKEILERLVPEDAAIVFSRDFETSGIEFLEAAKNMGLEGIVAKRKDSPYHTGDRTKDWLKIKANRRQEVVIGGYTKNTGSKKPFSALLVGVFEKRKFIYTGKIGTGFDLKTQRALLELFRPLVTGKPAFAETPDYNKPSRFRPDPPKASVTWMQPKLVCEVSFAEMTGDGVMRHPSFEGLRTDKKPEEVVMEKEADTNKVLQQAGGNGPIVRPRTSRDRRTLLNPADKTQARKVNSRELQFTNLDKVFWPKEKITKCDLINYYYQVAPYVLPYLKNRPLSLNRYPNGITGKSFYQKDVTGKVPDWIKTYLYHSEGDKTDKHFLLGDDEATLLYMANLGCIELHPWNSTTKKPDHPTYCIIDIDPDKNPFDEVIEVALATKSILDGLDVPCYCKTSGSTGLHIYIPLGAKYTYDQSKEFARVIVTLVHNEMPDLTSIERAVSARKGKIYLDFLQNRPHATIAAPYSLRPKPGATVSMPLHWEEVKKGLEMADFTIFNAPDRLKQEGDIFKPVLGKGIDLKKIIRNFRQENGSL